MLKLKMLDYSAVLLSLAVFIIFSINIYSGVEKAASVRIEAGGKIYLYPLDRDRIIKVEGPAGITVVHIENNTVYIHDSPCPDKLCILAGKLDETGQWAACLPNRVFVSVEGKADEKIDDLNY